jgi:hypothetical protein
MKKPPGMSPEVFLIVRSAQAGCVDFFAFLTTCLCTAAFLTCFLAIFFFTGVVFSVAAWATNGTVVAPTKDSRANAVISAFMWRLHKAGKTLSMTGGGASYEPAGSQAIGVRNSYTMICRTAIGFRPNSQEL